jgi:hypothetical protein
MSEHKNKHEFRANKIVSSSTKLGQTITRITLTCKWCGIDSFSNYSMEKPCLSDNEKMIKEIIE